MNDPIPMENMRHIFEWGRIQSPSDWLIPSVVFALLVLFAAYWCRRDSQELAKGWGYLFALLRTAALACVFLFFLEPQWRTEQLHVNRSKVVVLVDGSQSMALIDAGENLSRADQVAQQFSSGFLDVLRKTHDVVVKRFDIKSTFITQRSADRKETNAQPNDSPVSFSLPADLGGASATSAQGLSGADAMSTNNSAEKGDEGENAIQDWKTALAPTGLETRLGDCISQNAAEFRGAPLAGMVIISDGQNNAGLSPEAAAAASGEAKIPVHTLGVGDLARPADVRLNDVAAPLRAYPKDRFKITGYVQASGIAGQELKVELYSWDPAESPRVEKLERSISLPAPADQEIATVSIELEGAEKGGKRTFELRLPELPRETFTADNRRPFDVEFVERKTQILLIAGGPSREYLFLRNSLYRDKEMALDVWLQGTDAGISQESRQVLTEFPKSRAELFEYDLVIAIDPNWQALSPEQVSLLETFVAEQAGGLLVVAGPIYTDAWIRNESLAKLKALYPVRFHSRFSSRIDSDYGSKVPLPLIFTREGVESDFLWLGDTIAASEAAWKTFPGVYGYFNVEGVKDNATAYTYCGDADLAAPNKERVYMAGQLYGAGRVFYQASGEIWRTRSLDLDYFNVYYTKLIRHLTEGRLLRGSARGLLIVERDRYLLGDLVQVRAQLSDSRLEPLAAAEVLLDVAPPKGPSQQVKLLPDLNRAGLFTGQFTASDEGSHTLVLRIPETDNEVLTRRIDVRIPDRERQDPRRNADLLRAVAAQSGGNYYAHWDEALLGASSRPSLAFSLPDRTQTKYVSGPPNLEWQRNVNTWLLAVFAGCLGLEWLLRRLKKLA